MTADPHILTRHLSKSQRAIAVARLHPAPAPGGRGRVSEANRLCQEIGFSPALLTSARAVLRQRPDLADAVASGSMSLDLAYAAIRQSVQ